MVSLRKRIFFVLIQIDPAKGNRAAQINPAGYVFAAKDIHDDFKMRIGMFNLG